MVTIRRIQIGEHELFKRIRLASLRESPLAFGSTYESAIARTAESWREQADCSAQGSDRSTFIAFAAGSPIGIAALYRHKERKDLGELLQVWVAPEYRSTRVAVEVMDAVFHWAGANGFRKIVASVAKGNERALRFYRKYGFGPVDAASDTGSDDIVLIKEIAAERNAR
jgi:ribosomal protein S18 acetylase RimI-like enzyme